MGRSIVVENRPSWSSWVTPQLLRGKPIHRWYVFPHSFTSELVHGLIDEWVLGAGDRILDPFVGAGTTLLASKEKGVPATGYDLSPLAVLASRVKVASFRVERLQNAWAEMQSALTPRRWRKAKRRYPQLVVAALPDPLLAAFETIRSRIDDLQLSRSEKDFFRLALLAILPRFSRAVASGGWLKWVKKRSTINSIPQRLCTQVKLMMNDLLNSTLSCEESWDADTGDARCIPEPDSSYSAVITSPPYANRHDYTRVFGVELMFDFLNWEETRELRYQSFHSHPEARPERPPRGEYTAPRKLSAAIGRLKREGEEPKVLSLLGGYFLDSYHVLCEAKRVCKVGGFVGFVVGNVQYRGVPFAVDELIAEIGEQTGMSCGGLLAVR